MDGNLSCLAWEVESGITAVKRNLANKNHKQSWTFTKISSRSPSWGSDVWCSTAEKCPNDRRAGYHCTVLCFVMVRPAE